MEYRSSKYRVDVVVKNLRHKYKKLLLPQSKIKTKLLPKLYVGNTPSEKPLHLYVLYIDEGGGCVCIRSDYEWAYEQGLAFETSKYKVCAESKDQYKNLYY